MKLEPHVKRIAIAVVLGAIMSILSTTIVNVALETLSEQLHAPLDNVQWVVTGYMLALAAVIPASGWAAARFGARRLYIASLLLFTLGSLLCGLAWNLETLVGARVLQGLAGGLLLPIGQIALVKAAGPRNMARVMSAIGVPMILAPIFGPTLGGLLVEHVSWQSIFFINIPVGIGAAIAAFRLFPHDEAQATEPLDFPGLALVATGLVGITYGLAESGAAGSMAAPEVLVPALTGVALVAAFVIRALRIPNPLLDVRLYANKAFSAASVTTFGLGAALFGGMVLMPLYFQLVRGEDAVMTGLLLIPQGIGAALAMAASGRLTERLGGGLTSLMGGAIMIVATLPFVLIDATTSYLTLDAAMVVRGFGIGLSMMPAMTAAYATLRPEQVNDAAPQLNVLQRVGGSIGTAILTVVLQNGITANTPTAIAASFAHTYWWVVGVSIVALLPTVLLAIVERRTRREPEATLVTA
ncbi:DHA2 family efflux MFS transporter permease subunit [Solirubrobacter sp. CPCC 204708]|uniref:DHA2 family efflux MFS transporter permease subunit n=1 Tax=Solirubrobacter deserti TaxID=2282478 RepID=A0ABT4RSY9_9ACTN|nr:DHA2 family efflux MFS transporter permease subunit [Solirubrobacter deserti]MBE2315123.1 DHA2 family efflux MFS transporter permease subunit [Solirubrobacter deserti]MDA0141355.1 DHA2 family efflux MFS transporter permease subunit [Solirubrobacter deserti]